MKTCAHVLYTGHVLDVLRGLPDASVHCVVTSPPYWGLRNYRTQPLVWDAPGGCEHQWDVKGARPGTELGVGGNTNGIYGGGVVNPRKMYAADAAPPGGRFCLLCKAWEGSLGLEPSPGLYVQHLVQVFREVKRVLRDDGTFWCNMGDSFAGSGMNSGGPNKKQDSNRGAYWDTGNDGRLSRKGDGLKPKDLVGVPWRVAFALQDDGWYLRSDIIWAKSNPMPESVQDRPTKSHEHVFLFAKSQRYFYDWYAVAEPAQDTPHAQNKYNYPFGGPKALLDSWAKRGRVIGFREPWVIDDVLVRNRRSVWHINTELFKGAHFAIFPEALAELCIKAGTSEHGACFTDGAPWKRMLKKRPASMNIRVRDAKRGVATPGEGYGASESELKAYDYEHETVGGVQEAGWKPTCRCPGNTPVPPTVLDPFGGAGTVSVVAKKLGLSSIYIDLNPEYTEMAQRRIEGDGQLGLFEAYRIIRVEVPPIDSSLRIREMLRGVNTHA